MDGGDERLLRAFVFLAGTLEDLRGGDALFLEGGDAAGEDGLGDGRGGDAHVEGVGGGPFAGAFLAGGVEDDVDEGFFLRERILLLEDVGGDFDEEAVEGAGVPLAEDFAHFGGLEPEEALHEGVGLADHLHVAIFDAVVDHLDVVARAVFADVGGAGDAADDGFAGGGADEGLAGLGVDLGGDGVPDRGEFLVGGAVAAGHEGRAEAGAFFAAGHAGADEAETFFLHRLLAADGVGPEGVAAVDDDVVGLEERDEAVDDRVGGLTGLDEDDHLAGLREGGDELLERLGPDETAGGGGIFGDELFGFFDRAVVNRDLEAVVGDVEGEVLTHHGEADESDVGVSFGHKRGGIFYGSRRGKTTLILTNGHKRAHFRGVPGPVSPGGRYAPRPLHRPRRPRQSAARGAAGPPRAVLPGKGETPLIRPGQVDPERPEPRGPEPARHHARSLSLGGDGGRGGQRGLLLFRRVGTLAREESADPRHRRGGPAGLVALEDPVEADHGDDEHSDAGEHDFVHLGDLAEHQNRDHEGGDGEQRLQPKICRDAPELLSGGGGDGEEVHDARTWN